MLDKEAIITKKPWSAEGQAQRIALLEQELSLSVQYLDQKQSFTDVPSLRGNIEHYIGMTQIPTGIVGPLLMEGSEARGEFYVPLATTEGALVASYHRGTIACRMGGAISATVISETVQRSPLFRFATLAQVLEFVTWATPQLETYRTIVAQHSRFAKLSDLKVNIEANHVHLVFEYNTGDAAGQNMVTVCTDAICHYILQNTPVKPHTWYIDGNYSGDKKVRASAFTMPRGKYVTAEIVLPEKIVKDVLRATPQSIAAFWQSSAVGAVKMGSPGLNAHFSNGLAALFIACGQDAACVGEASIGVSRAEVTANGDLYGSVTLPNLIVGTVGGGTHLPTQQECLKIMDCYGSGKARKFAEICAALLLAGEFSIAAAISNGHFARAHKLYGRKKS